ncbi:MAG TPA: phosphatase PAP2 family protein [Streptosporangiaceae bacterium]
MSRSPAPRYAQPATAVGRGRQTRVPGRTWTPRHGLARLLAGVALSILVLLVGVLAKTGPVSSLGLRVDRHIAMHDRTSTLTTLARAVSTIATPEIVGAGLMIVMPLVLVLARRRLDALKVFCMFGGALILAEIGKKLINEHRPPTSLWAMTADSGSSYPSGHTTTAAVFAVALIVIATTLAGRSAALVLGGMYVIAVAVSRVYLADHYPLDVIGGMLCALAAAFIVTGLAALPALQPYLQRLGTRSGRHR